MNVGRQFSSFFGKKKKNKKMISSWPDPGLAECLAECQGFLLKYIQCLYCHFSKDERFPE